MTVLGIDIGSDTIKIVEMAKAAHHSFRLINYVIAPTPPDAVVDGDVRDPEMVGEALREVLKAQRFKANRVVTSVQGTKSTVVRIIELPRVSKNELAESMKFEVERHIPFAASQIIMDYAVVERPGEAHDSPNMEVLFAAVQEEVVELVVEALQRAKLKPLAIDVQPLALSRALVEAPIGGHPVGETVAIVNMGATVTDLSIVRDGLLHFPRTVPLAGRTITQRLSEGLGVSEQQAERLKREHGNVVPLPPGMVPVTPVVEEPVEAEAPDEIGVGLDFEDVFQSDTGTESDVGFFGAGVASSGFQLDESEPGEAVERPEEEGSARTPFQLEETDNSEPGDGDFFNFNFDDNNPGGTSFTLGPPDDDEPDAPVPDDEPFSFTDDTETDEPPVFSFGDDEDEAEPEAPALALDATEEDAPVAPAKPVVPQGETVTDTATADTPAAAEEEVAPFAFDATEPEATTEGTPTFQFDATDEETTAAEGPGALAGGAAEEPVAPAPDAGLFDFNLGDTQDDSSLNVDVAPAAADQTGTTDVGSSFDLGDLATSESFDFDLAEVSEETQEGAGFNFTEPVAAPAAGAPPAPMPTVGGPAPAMADEALQVRQVIEPVMREIATEIGRSLDYYRSRYEGAVVDRLVIAGGTARMEGLAEFLEEELGLPVDRGDPLATLTVDNAKLTDEDLRRDAPVLAVAIGLALRELM